MMKVLLALTVASASVYCYADSGVARGNHAIAIRIAEAACRLRDSQKESKRNHYYQVEMQYGSGRIGIQTTAAESTDDLLLKLACGSELTEITKLKWKRVPK